LPNAAIYLKNQNEWHFHSFIRYLNFYTGLNFTRIYIVFLFFVLAAENCFGQFGADFTVVSNVGCDPFTVSVINLSTAPPSEVITYNYDNTVETNDTFHVYTSPGEYWIVQTVANANPRQDSVLVRIVEPVPPKFILANCKGTGAFFLGKDTLYNAYYIDWGDGNNEIVNKGTLAQHDYGVLGSFNVGIKGLVNASLSETDQANLNCSFVIENIIIVNDIVAGKINRIEVLNPDSILLNHTIDPQTSYLVEMSTNGSSSFSTIDTISSGTSPNSYLVDGLNTFDNYYCFRLTAFDPCDGETRPSLTACSIRLSGTAANNENQLDWLTETTDLNIFSVNRDSSPIASTTNQQFTDTNVECGISYCYQVIMNENNGFQSISDTVCVTAFSNDVPPQLTEINATVENETIQLNWDEPSNIPAYYLVNRYEKGGDNPFQTTTNANSYVDSSANPQQKQYFYEISYENLCGNVSPPTLTSPVFLSKYLNSTIFWTNYLGWSANVRAYILDTYDQDGQLISTLDLSTDTVYTENDFLNLPQQVLFRITALPNTSGNPDVHSNFVRVIFPSSVVFPNAFTPNGDGLNDRFIFEGLYISSFRMIIYNKWGEAIFETDSPETGWDGRVNSKPAPSDMYIFNAEFIDDAGISFVKKGEVYLLR